MGVRDTEAPFNNKPTELLGIGRFFWREDRWEEGTDTGYGLEHVEHFAKIIFEFLIMLNEVPPPFGRIPNF